MTYQGSIPTNVKKKKVNSHLSKRMYYGRMQVSSVIVWGAHKWFEYDCYKNKSNNKVKIDKIKFCLDSAYMCSSYIYGNEFIVYMIICKIMELIIWIISISGQTRLVFNRLSNGLLCKLDRVDLYHPKVCCFPWNPRMGGKEEKLCNWSNFPKPHASEPPLEKTFLWCLCLSIFFPSLMQFPHFLKTWRQLMWSLKLYGGIHISKNL